MKIRKGNRFGRLVVVGRLKKDHRYFALAKFRTHGLRHSGEYRSWYHAKQRCLNPKDISYKNYGGRGISLWRGWIDDFKAFYDYIGPRPSPRHTLDRKDNNGNYEPGNIRWSTRRQQGNNTRRNIFVVFNGKRVTLAQACRKAGLSYSAVYQRIRKARLR